MSSIECILDDLRMCLGIISAVPSPRNVPNNATSSILGLRPRDKAAMLGVNTIEILFETFT